MVKGIKICGVSDTKTLRYIINHRNPPQFIGFIVNYPKSKRYVNIKKLKELTKIDKRNSFYVAVLVNPEKGIYSDYAGYSTKTKIENNRAINKSFLM